MVFKFSSPLFFCFIIFGSCKVNENMKIYVDQTVNEIEKRGYFKQEDVFLLNSLYIDFSLRDRLLAIDSTNVCMYLNKYNLNKNECVNREFDTEIIELERPYLTIEELINSKSSTFYKEYLEKEALPPFSKKYNSFFLIYRDKVFVKYQHNTIPEYAEVFELKDYKTVLRKTIYVLLD